MLNLAAKRLKVEYTKLQRDPVPLAIAAPLEKNILEWRFIIQGIEDYEGGYYQGKLIFPQEYPLKPPGVMFLTPNGRFQTNKRICLSISDYHPESWTPSWTVGTILTGIISFFNCDDATVGSIQSTSVADKRKFAMESKEFNTKDKVYLQLFGMDPAPLFQGYISPSESSSASSSSSSSVTPSEVVEQDGNNKMGISNNNQPSVNCVDTVDNADMKKGEPNQISSSLAALTLSDAKT